MSEYLELGVYGWYSKRDERTLLQASSTDSPSKGIAHREDADITLPDGVDLHGDVLGPAEDEIEAENADALAAVEDVPTGWYKKLADVKVDPETGDLAFVHYRNGDLYSNDGNVQTDDEGERDGL